MNKTNDKKVEKIAKNIVSKNICGMAKVFDDSGYRFAFYSADLNEPVHIHVVKDENEAKFWIQDKKYGKSNISNWDHSCSMVYDGGFKQNDLNKIKEIIERRRDEIIEKWKTALGIDDIKQSSKKTNILAFNKVYVESINKDGFNIIINGKKIFVDFEKSPIFKNVQINDIFNVHFFGKDALEWEDADIHLPIDALINPEKYTLRFPAKHIDK